MQALNDRLRGARLAQSLEASGHGHTGMVGIVIGFKPMISGELAKFCVQVYILNVALVNFFSDLGQTHVHFGVLTSLYLCCFSQPLN